ncbi:ABC transporter substrate-binding protein [Thiolinea disciformis]|uniref:ABC transporter substrate-binding protein n=1 Tax=Thiolinea disciformis TaxID=125614 RepID=UPI00036415D6|nr:ABC transporter substrate-binding protein [Thiolinea disciformis]
MTIRVLKTTFIASALAMALAGTVAAEDTKPKDAAASVKKVGEVEVLHWWTAGGEAKALGVLKEMLEGQGVSWKDMPVAGGGGEKAMTVLRSRVQAGNPPTAVQMLGFDIRDWAKEGATANLDDLATKEGWEKVVPEALQAFSRYEGHWVASPVNVHSTNWVWANKKVMDDLGVTEAPKDFDALISILDKAKEKGITPLAIGGQPWQEATLFEAVALSTGGPEFYKKAFIDLDKDALTSDNMKKTFDRMKKLRSYADANFSGRDWNLAAGMVIEGKAALQVMGDWAKGEFLNAKKVPDTDFLCYRFPGTQGNVTFNADQFVMFKVKDDQTEAQNLMAKDVMDPKFQIAFNLVKGSVPARTDVSDAEFDACGKKGMKDLAEASKGGTLLGSMAHGYAAPAAVKNAIYDVVTKHFNSDVSADDAVKQLAAAVEGAKE